MLPPIIGVLFDGFAYGMLLFLLSVGQSVTLGMMNFINLAHCSFRDARRLCRRRADEPLWAGRSSRRCRLRFVVAAVVSVVFERTVLPPSLSCRAISIRCF